MTKRRQPANPRVVGERDEHMTHCTNCSCPMTCNAFERCVREPERAETRSDAMRREAREAEERAYASGQKSALIAPRVFGPNSRSFGRDATVAG